MNEFLEAFEGYAPWVAVTVIAVLYRIGLMRCLNAVALRLRRGASVKVGPFELGGDALIRSTGDATERGLVAEKYGNPDNFRLLFKAVGPRLVKSTKAMQVPGGCLVLVSSELWSADGEWSTAEALEFVPGVAIQQDPTVLNGYVLDAPTDGPDGASAVSTPP